MNIWDFLHAHADGIGTLIFCGLLVWFMVQFIREANK